MRLIVMLMLFAFGWNSCTDSGDHQLVSELKYADSIELRIINDHDKPDTDDIAKIRSIAVIQIIAAAVNGNSTDVDSCDIEGKMYFFRGENVFKTVYFSLNDNCHFFAYVINGKKYFVEMKDDALIYMKNLITKSFAEK